jgi:hypothetical protein
MGNVSDPSGEKGTDIIGDTFGDKGKPPFPSDYRRHTLASGILPKSRSLPSLSSNSRYSVLDPRQSPLYQNGQFSSVLSCILPSPSGGATQRDFKQPDPLRREEWMVDTNAQTKRTKKVGVTGKYGTRYGASLRKT